MVDYLDYIVLMIALMSFSYYLTTFANAFNSLPFRFFMFSTFYAASIYFSVDILEAYASNKNVIGGFLVLICFIWYWNASSDASSIYSFLI